MLIIVFDTLLSMHGVLYNGNLFIYFICETGDFEEEIKSLLLIVIIVWLLILILILD